MNRHDAPSRRANSLYQEDNIRVRVDDWDYGVENEGDQRYQGGWDNDNHDEGYGYQGHQHYDRPNQGYHGQPRVPRRPNVDQYPGGDYEHFHDGYNQNGNRGYQRNYQTNHDQGSYLGTSETSNKDIMDFLKEMKKANEVRDKSVEALSKQVGQLAEEVAIYTNETGKLPSDTVVNPLHQSSTSKNKKKCALENSKEHIKVEARSSKSPNGLKKPPKHIKH
ncbi:hypothetical protein E3N88_04732 [Mikania micrantha]|uniref:Uncharacterized protein n=1 Tax=Mikania micrantha TaxID=192012 RepID=A0A5N6PV92_9ASTR|nr:hypothetical protein E3N88_04732 [Mikania micrantha]